MPRILRSLAAIHCYNKRPGKDTGPIRALKGAAASGRVWATAVGMPVVRGDTGKRIVSLGGRDLRWTASVAISGLGRRRVQESHQPREFRRVT